MKSASSSAQNWQSSNLYLEICCFERVKVKHQCVLRLTLLASALLPFGLLNWTFSLLFECVEGGIFQIANIAPD